MKIVLSPDPILRETCEAVDLADGSIKRLAKQMAKEMYKNNGCGLAAPQVGIVKRLIVIDCDVDSDKRNPIYLINPVISEHGDETWTGEEGCLSVPGISVPIERYKDVKVTYTDLDGSECEIEAGPDLLGRCLQHEIDHLDGITMFEHLDPMTKIKALQAYQAALEAGITPADDRTSVI